MVSGTKKGKKTASGGRMPKVSKKEQIISLFTNGITDPRDIAFITGSRSSYVASGLGRWLRFVVMESASVKKSIYLLRSRIVRARHRHSCRAPK